MNAHPEQSGAYEAAADAPTEKLGYCSPPISKRFQKGASGNPKGRPKKSKNLKTDLMEELNELVTVKSGGKIKKIRKQRAMIKAAVAKAAQGDPKAFSHIISLAVQINPPEADTDGAMPTSQEDQEILQTYETWKSKVNAGS